MKKLLLFLLFSNFLSVFAQDVEDKSYLEIQDELYQHLDKDNMSTGVFYNRVYPWADLTAIEEKSSFNYSFAIQAWHELYLASYQKDGLLNLEQAREKSRQNERDGKGISIGYINYQYNYLDSNAIANGHLVIGEDSLFNDGVSPASAYVEKQMILPVIFADEIQDGEVLFYLDADLILSNSPKEIFEYISIETPNGEVVKIGKGESKIVSFEGFNEMTVPLILRLVFKGRTVIVSWKFDRAVMVIQNSKTTDKCVSEDIERFYSGADLAFQGYDETMPTQGRGEYKIFYHLDDIYQTYCDNRILKPIIFIDGFDPMDKRQIDRCVGNNCKTFWELLSFGYNKHLGDSLRLKGYDIILLNFPIYEIPGTRTERDGGADYIERNAMVLTKLIQNINDSLMANSSEEELVIVGPSMGGQIARYALAYMEKQHSLGVPKMNHNARLYVSFDSPHLGANISIALQQALYFLGTHGNQTAAEIQYKEQLLSKAARQMLIEQMGGLNKSSPFFQTYYNNNLVNNGLPNSNGWPQNVRKVSLINGASNGQTTSMPNQTMLEGNAWSSLSITGLDLTLKTMPSYNQERETFNGMIRNKYTGLGVFGFNSGTYFNYTGLIVPNLKEKLQFSRTLAGVWYGLVLDTYRGDYTIKNMNTNGSMDVVPGGTFEAIDAFKIEIAEILDGREDIKGQEWNTNAKKHSFIPSVSALGFKNPNFNWATRFDNRDLICTNEIPFDNYFTAEYNENHVFISEEAAKWVMEEIEKGQPGCPPICNTGIIEIPRVHCLSSIFTVTVNGPLIPGVTLAWEYNSSVLLKTSETGISATFRVIGNILSTEIKVILQNPCGANKEFIKELSLGTPPVSHTFIDANLTSGTKRIEVTPGLNSPYNYSWSNNGTVYYTTSQKHLSDPFLPASNKYLWLKIEHPCKATQTIQFNLGITLPDDPFSAKVHSPIEVYPNPSGKVWNINAGHSGTVYYSLTDINGKVIKSGKTTETFWQIDNQQIASGVYFLKLYNHEFEEVIKIVKQ